MPLPEYLLRGCHAQPDGVLLQRRHRGKAERFIQISLPE
jgi:hypothetical protein